MWRVAVRSQSVAQRRAPRQATFKRSFKENEDNALPAQLIKVHRKLDLGLLKLTPNKAPYPHLELGDERSYGLGKRSLRSAIQTACNGASPAAL